MAHTIFYTSNIPSCTHPIKMQLYIRTTVCYLLDILTVAGSFGLVPLQCVRKCILLLTCLILFSILGFCAAISNSVPSFSLLWFFKPACLRHFVVKTFGGGFSFFSLTNVTFWKISILYCYFSNVTVHFQQAKSIFKFMPSIWYRTSFLNCMLLSSSNSSCILLSTFVVDKSLYSKEPLNWHHHSYLFAVFAFHK